MFLLLIILEVLTNEVLYEVFVAVEQGLNIRKASEKYAIPWSTLHDHISGKVKLGAKQGQNPYLTIAQEELVSFLMKCAQMGYPHTRKQVLSLVKEILKEKVDNKVNLIDGWFKDCNPLLTLQVPAPLSCARAVASSRESLDYYFNLLEETLKSNGIFNRPSHIYNYNETGVPLNPLSF